MKKQVALQKKLCEKKHKYPLQPVDTLSWTAQNTYLNELQGLQFGQRKQARFFLSLGYKGAYGEQQSRRDRMVPPAPDSRSVMAKAYSWAARIITVAMEMVAPGLVGLWIDRRLGTIALFTVVGFGGGLVLGMWHLLKMTSRKGEPTEEGPQGRK